VTLIAITLIHSIGPHPLTMSETAVRLGVAAGLLLLAPVGDSIDAVGVVGLLALMLIGVTVVDTCDADAPRTPARCMSEQGAT
jgi:hypothetical protein